MGLDHLNVCLHWKNLTASLSCWHRGTASQFDVTKDHHLQLPIVLTDFGTDVVIVTMAARIVQSIISLGKNLLQKHTMYWRMLPRVFVSRALRAVVVVCWSVLDVLLPLLMSMYLYKRAAAYRSEQQMNMVSIKCQWGSGMELEEIMDGDTCSLKIEAVEDIVIVEVNDECEQMPKEEVPLQSCTNPFIMSMICVPTEGTDSSEESEVESVKGLDFSQEEKSVDSGLQESWTPGSKYDEDLSDESDWSDEDSWDEDEDSNSCHEDDDLWASFCRSDDPYNPLSFAMPTKAPEQPKKKASTESLKTKILENVDGTVRCDVKMECGTATEKQKMKTKPVLSGYKSTHKCTPAKEEATEEGDQSTKKVRFSPKVTIHPIVTWSFAHRMARKGQWEEYARDRCRFQRRIAEAEVAIGFCLTSHHREKIRAGLEPIPTRAHTYVPSYGHVNSLSA
ncbi:uncharacterized protein ACNLHF_002469 [Anomaloglossus baeobatrachus]|uniref:uncharacterized protein LOC142256213 n=1 Tax=Anomaloglossus baeobatrachus TaxID=238106 RepID=UPI003F50A3A3